MNLPHESPNYWATVTLAVWPNEFVGDFTAGNIGAYRVRQQLNWGFYDLNFGLRWLK